MFHLLVAAALCASCLADTSLDFYSFSKPVGGSSGESFSLSGEGRITGVRVWENGGSYIRGIQLRYGYIWSEVVGREYGTTLEIDLADGEVIVQISGKYSSYVYQVYFVTSRGRFLMGGQPTSWSFNMYPKYPQAELKMLSGHASSNGISSLAAHWGMIFMAEGNNGNSSSTMLLK